YRLIRLSNELEALLIHDPTTDKSSASLDVCVGNLSDPFLSKHSGHSNAYTGLDNTNYYFEVGYEFLEEHKKNRQSDPWRLFQLERSLSDPKHPYSRFGSGNLFSLGDIPRQKGLDIRNELLKFHERYYSANLMKLVVLDPLDLMASWVVDKFSAVKNKHIPAPTFEGHPLTQNELLPGRYLTHLISHEGYGSILSLLKKKEAGSVPGAVGFEFFKVSIDLTESGVDHYKEVVKVVFQYIKMLKQIEYNPKLIVEGLKCLEWDKFVLTLVSPSFTGLDQKEPWYGTEYKVEPFSMEFIEELKNLEIDPELNIPPPNEFIPTKFETHKHEIVTSFSIRAITIALYKNQVNNLTEYSYNADLAGLRYDIDTQREGILLTIKGYNDKLHVLLKDIVDAMNPKFIIYPGRFEKVKERLQRAYKNTFLDPPHHHATYYLSCLTQDQMWTNKEKLDALEDITEQDIKAFYPELFSHLHIESLVHGNMFKEEALRLLQIVEDVLQPKPLLPAELIGCRSIMLPEGKRYLYQREVLDPNNVNSAIEYYVQVGNVVNKRLRAKSSLLAQIMHEPCFDQLRTKEQLEYQRQIQSLITKKLEKPKNLYQEAQRYWNHIDSGYYDFNQVETDVAELREITKLELLEFYKQLVHPSSPIQKKLSVHLRSQKNIKKSKPIDINHLYSCLTAQGLTTITIENLQTFLSSKETVDGQELETLLKQFLIDQSKAQEREIEELIKNVGESYLIENSVDEEKVEYGNATDVRLLDLRPGNEKIEDIYVWKSNMQLGPAPTPSIRLNDLMSKL
ncbi:18063_t:CDS:10, partial [Racocetra fulgida]